MKFRAAAASRLPKHLWRGLANEMSLAGPLPAVPGQPNTLSVDVGPQHSQAEGTPSLVGDYANRLIRVYPCVHCSAGYLTLTFLHEFAHAWIDTFHPHVTDDDAEEEFAETFCQLAYASLPASPGTDCSNWTIGLPTSARRSRGFQKFFRGFAQACPPSPAARDAIDACYAAAGLPK